MRKVAVAREEWVGSRSFRAKLYSTCLWIGYEEHRKRTVPFTEMERMEWGMLQTSD